jgi:GAF domain-containing protein
MADVVEKIKRWTTAPVFADRQISQRAALLNTVLWLLLLAVVVTNGVAVAFVGPLVLLRDWLFLPSASLVMVVAVFILREVMKLGRPRLAATILVTLMWVIVSLWLWFVGGLSGGRVAVIYTLLISLAALLIGSQGGIIFTGLSVAGIVVAYGIEQQGWLVPVVEAVDIFGLVVMTIVFVLIGALLHSATRTMSRALRDAAISAEAQREANRQLTALQAELEERVEERTVALAHRSFVRQATAEVGRAVMEHRDAGVLLQAVVTVISEQFACYHTGIFLLGAAARGTSDAQVLVLRVINETDAETEGLEVGHLVGLTKANVVGEVARLRSPRIALRGGPQSRPVSGEGGGDAFTAYAPLMEMSAAEVALPLVASGQLRGVLDIHSLDPDRFQPEDLNALQMMADQIVMALENAELMMASRQALEAERSAYRRGSREDWARLVRAGLVPGFRYVNREIVPIGDVWHPEMQDALVRQDRVVQVESDGDAAVVAAPIQVRGETVGVLDLRKRKGGGAWTERELEVLETLTTQLESALENARLYQDSQRRATREQISRQITDRIRSALSVEEAMRRAVEELARIAGASEMVARVGTERALLASKQGDGDA